MALTFGSIVAVARTFLLNYGGMGSASSMFTRGSESNHTAVLLNGRRLPSGFLATTMSVNSVRII